MRKPRLAILGEFYQLGHFGNGDGVQHFLRQQFFRTARTGLRQTVIAGDLVTQAQQRTIQMKQC